MLEGKFLRQRTWIKNFISTTDFVRATLIGVTSALVVIVFPALRMYFVNHRSLDVEQDLVFTAISISAITFFLFVFITFLITPQKWLSKVTLVCLVAVILIWLFSNIMVWDLGPFDGEELKLRKYWGEIAFEVLIAGFCIFFLYRFSGYVLSKYRFICLGVFLSSALSLMTPLLNFLNYEPRYELGANYKFDLNDPELYQFSSGKNVLVFVVDTIGTSVATQIFAQDPDLKNKFQGFTLFADNITPFSRTLLSASAMLTNQLYDNSQTIDDFLYEAHMSKTSLVRQLKRAGFDTRMATFYKPPYLRSPMLWRNIVGYKSVASDLSGLIQLWLYNISPLRLKIEVKNTVDFSGSQNRTAFKGPMACGQSEPPFDASVGKKFDRITTGRLLGCSKVTFEQPVFRWFHSWGGHGPFVFATDTKNPPKTRKNLYFLESKFSLKRIGAVLERLKALGIYDNTFIAIAGDHGLIVPKEKLSVKFMNLLKKIIPSEFSSRVDAVPYFEEAFGLLMIKPPGAVGDMSVSLAPTTSTDISATIMAEMDLKHSGVGRPVFSLKENENRLRIHRTHEFHITEFSYAPGLREYTISGRGWWEDSWSSTFKRFQPGDRLKTNKEVYAWFFKGGNGGSFKTSGLGDVTLTGRRLAAPTAEIVLDVPPGLGLNGLLSWSVYAKLDDPITLDVFANGSKLAQLEINHNGLKLLQEEAQIGPGVLENARQLDIMFKLANFEESILGDTDETFIEIRDISLVPQ